MEQQPGESVTTVEPTNLMEGLLFQLNRSKEVLKMYEEIPQGFFGATMIRQSISKAEAAINSGDVVAMLTAYRDLKEIQ